MKTVQALIDDTEYQLKSRGSKYYDRVSLATVTNEPIEIDYEDISLPEDLAVKQKQDIISEAMRRIFSIVHQPYCKELHRLTWKYGKLQGRLITELPAKVWIKGSRHPIRRFMP